MYVCASIFFTENSLKCSRAHFDETETDIADLFEKKTYMCTRVFFPVQINK